MKQAFVNDDFRLVLAPKRNGVPYSGAVVSARVVDVRTDAELLPATALPEVGTTGIYKYLWTTPPANETEVAVIYSVAGRAKMDYVAFRSREYPVGQSIKGTVTQSKVTIDVSQTEMKAVVSSDQKLAVVQPAQAVNAELSQDQNLTGVLED